MYVSPAIGSVLSSYLRPGPNSEIQFSPKNDPSQPHFSPETHPFYHPNPPIWAPNRTYLRPHFVGPIASPYALEMPLYVMSRLQHPRKIERIALNCPQINFLVYLFYCILVDQKIPTNYVPLASAYAIAFCWSNKHQQNHVALPSALDMVLSVSLLFTLEGSTAYLDHPYMHDSWRHLVAHRHDTSKKCNDNPSIKLYKPIQYNK